MKKKIISSLVLIISILILFSSKSYGDITYGEVSNSNIAISDFFKRDFKNNESYEFEQSGTYGNNDIFAKYCMCLGHPGSAGTDTVYLKTIIDINNNCIEGNEGMTGNNNVTIKKANDSGWTSNTFNDNTMYQFNDFSRRYV